jgi:hypothetical protein
MKSGPQELVHIEVPENVAGDPGDGRIVADNFSFPLRVDKIPHHDLISSGFACWVLVEM